MRDAIAKLPWVERVEARKRWPDTVDLVVYEQQPYARWGAVGRVAAIDLAHPNLDRGGGAGLVDVPGVIAPRAGAQTSGATGVQLPLALDFASLFKATQAFAEEIELDRLLDKIMAIVVENAGAARGVLLLDRGQGLVGARSYAIAETRSVDLGGVQVEASYHGFAQTGGDLFVRVPSAKVLWTGNPLVADKPAIPWLLAGHGQEVGVTLSQVKSLLPADTIIIPGHDRPTTLGGFDFAINYLNAMVSEVSSAVGQGLTVDQTVSAVALPSFQGYAIWDFIHKQVNVPTTYAEIKK